MIETSAAAENLVETAAPQAETKSLDVDSLSKNLAEIWEYLLSFFRARAARIQVSAREAILAVFLWWLITLLVVGSALIALAFVFYGGAQGLGEWLGRPWLGYLILGGGFLALIVAYIPLQLKSLRRKSLSRRIQAYESQLRKQRAAFSHDAEERAAADRT